MVADCVQTAYANPEWSRFGRSAGSSLITITITIQRLRVVLRMHTRIQNGLPTVAGPAVGGWASGRTLGILLIAWTPVLFFNAEEADAIVLPAARKPSGNITIASIISGTN